VGARRESVDRQSPGLAESAMGAYQSQLAQLTNRDARRKTENNSDDLIIYELLKRRGDEQAHHKSILETLDVLYRGLDEKESAELSAYLNQHGGIGNQLLNLINLPKDSHQEGIHKFARNKGYEYHSGTKNPEGMVLDMIEASKMPLEYRKHVGEQYLKKAVPEMNDYINDLLTNHPSMQEKLDLSTVREAVAAEEAKRMAGKAMDQGMMRQYLESGEDLQASGQVGSHKPIVVNADEGANVYVHTDGNDSGNRHPAMQQEFNRARK
jgi:hypothetical protein